MASKQFRLRIVLSQLAIVAVLLALPQILVDSHLISPFALAPTDQIFIKFVELIRTGVVVDALVQTLLLVFLTFLAVAVTGLVVGFCFWRWRLVRDGVEPVMLALYAIPGVIFYPLLLVLLGIGPPSIMGLGFILGVVPVIIGVQDALGSVDPVLNQTAVIMGASPTAKYFKVIFPAALADIGGALRLGFSYVVIGIISGQFLVSTGGLGKLVADYYDQFQIPSVYATAIFIVLLAALLNGILERLQ